MGNRGTTPSWDDEQIAKYGLFEHLRATSWRFTRAAARQREREVRDNLENVLEVLGDTSEETQKRVTVAIPDVLAAITLENLAMENWRDVIASRVYDDWRKRTGKETSPDFFSLKEEDQEPFLLIVDAIMTARAINSG